MRSRGCGLRWRQFRRRIEPSLDSIVPPQPIVSRSAFGILDEITSSGGGEIGRRTSLRCWRPQGIGVQVPSSAPEPHTGEPGECRKAA